MPQPENNTSSTFCTPCSLATAEHYRWGGNCDGWHLVDSPELSIIQERMPPGSAEQYHYHQRAQQFFYVLAGTATFVVEGAWCTVAAQQGLHIPPLTRHRILNRTPDELVFTVTSQPKAHGDRVTIPSAEKG